MEKYSKNKSFVANYFDSIPVIAEKPSVFHVKHHLIHFCLVLHFMYKPVIALQNKSLVSMWNATLYAYGFYTGTHGLVTSLVQQGSHIGSSTCHAKFKDKLHEITVNKVIISLKLKSTCFTCPCMFMINRVLDLLHKANWSTFRGNEWTEFIRIPAEEPPIPPWNVCKHSPDFTFHTYQMNNTPN